MHLNYHYLKFLCPEIQNLIKGMRVSACFSQNKNELIIGFTDNNKERYIRANLAPATTCLAFPDEFTRSKKNNVTLFRDILQETVEQVRVLEFERAFTLHFTSGKILLFKLHGTRSNLLLFPDENAPPLSMFRQELREDALLTIRGLRNPMVPDWARFVGSEGNASVFLPTLGKIPREWLKEKGYSQAHTLEEKWKLMELLMDRLEHPVFSILKKNASYQFSLLPSDETIYRSEDPVEAANEFFKYAVIFSAFEREKNSLIKKLNGQKKGKPSLTWKKPGIN